MALKMEIDSLDGLPPDLAAVYKAGEDGKSYRLDVDGEGSDERLLRALRSERHGRKAAERTARDHETEATQRVRELEDAVRARDAALAATTKMRERLLDSAVQTAATAAGVYPSAVADATRAAREAFSISDAGEVVARDEMGRFTNLSQWIVAQREVAPHWFPATGSGGGAVQSSSNFDGRSRHTMTRAVFDALAPVQRALAMQQGIRITD